jgi:hypothetical protein
MAFSGCPDSDCRGSSLSAALSCAMASGALDAYLSSWSPGLPAASCVAAGAGVDAHDSELVVTDPEATARRRRPPTS